MIGPARPHLARILSTSSTEDVIQFNSGTHFQRLKNIDIGRTVVPSGSAHGLGCYSADTYQVENVTSDDSTDIDMKYAGAYSGGNADFLFYNGTYGNVLTSSVLVIAGPGGPIVQFAKNAQGNLVTGNRFDGTANTAIYADASSGFNVIGPNLTRGASFAAGPVVDYSHSLVHRACPLLGAAAVTLGSAAGNGTVAVTQGSTGYPDQNCDFVVQFTPGSTAGTAGPLFSVQFGDYKTGNTGGMPSVFSCDVTPLASAAAAQSLPYTSQNSDFTETIFVASALAAAATYHVTCQ